MTQEEIIKRLEETGYSCKAALSVSKDLSHLDAQLNPILSEWVSDKTETDYSAEGYSIRQLMSEFSMKYPAALLTMDWLLKDPRKAKEALEFGIK